MPIVTLQTTGVFTGYTLGQFRALILRMLRSADTKRFSPTKGAADYDWIDDALNRGQDDFVRLTRCLRNYAVCELKSGQRLYRVPDDYLDALAVYYYDGSLDGGYKQIAVTSIDSLNQDVSGWRTELGTPKNLYLDRNYGQGQTYGLYPIPEKDGDVPVFSSDYGIAVQWVCPLYTFNQDIGTIINISSADEWILNSQEGIACDIQVTDGNLLIEYARLPQELNEVDSNTDQMSEIPREYQKALCYYAAADLLSDNPEDSAEFKRSQYFENKFKEEVAIYNNRQKRPPTARMLRVVPAVWNWQRNMTYYKEMA